MKVSNDDFEDFKWPPGFRFHPNDDELVLYYLKRKICHRRIKDNVIGELDVYKWEPEELPGQSVLKTGDRQWFFFSHRDRRYPSGGRVSRATRNGYWKATGKDRNVIGNDRTVGVKKTLVFYRGRAPSGERTDWVMHEYTVAEEELRRCPTPQDSYALYKVFKKSGPGPKNGEQYGATFREEDWADEDDPVDAGQPINGTLSVDGSIPYDHGQLPENEIEVNDIIVDQSLIDFPHIFNQVGGEEEAVSTMVDPSLGEVISVEPRLVLHPGDQHSGAQASFEVTLSPTSNMYSCDASEVTSAPTISEQGPYVVDDDFIEIDDLLDPQLGVPEMGNASENLHPQEMIGGNLHPQEMIGGNLHPQEINGWNLPPQEMNGGNLNLPPQEMNGGNLNLPPQEMNGGNLNLPPQEMNGGNLNLPPQEINGGSLHSQEMNEWDPDVYFDAFMFLKDLGPIDQGIVPASYIETLQGEAQLSSHVDHTNNVSSELWAHEQRHSIFASPGSDQVVVAPPTSGFVYAGSSTDILVEARQNQVGSKGEPQNSRISSKIWAILESVPTNPASASESPLINRAFDRMSSFGRVRINPLGMDAAATGEGTPIERTGRSRGFGFLSFIGVIRPVLLVLMLSVAVKFLWTFFGKFVPS